MWFKTRSRLAYKYFCTYHLIMADITGRQDAAQKCMKNISSLLQGTDDPDHVLSLLTQASAALKAVSPLRYII